MDERDWYTELHGGPFGLTIRRDQVLIRERTPYQQLEIFENEALGRVLLLDDAVMLTERDEFIYHEMLVHPGMLAHPDPHQVLVVGGGDGGTLREVVKHQEVEQATLCEIDEAVINLSREFLPFTAAGLDHPKSTIHVGDGLEYIRSHREEFDVVIVDSTDPVGMAEGLFRSPFYRDVKASLKPGGLLVQQAESPFYGFETWPRTFSELASVFRNVHCYGAAIPMYPSGYWTFAFGSDDLTPKSWFDPLRADRLEGLRYYSSELQDAAFQLPRFARLALASEH
ncbi:MAG: polyamine aminopropyltransferase [Deltaproteobacteria bacterium]|nr:polyamine aminopropyltransferase [Deltaproteobacteria bacterium]